ncbi:MAG: hypothetical protein K2R98_12880 [Gemmataceae bacterium]|nr:hypothetical protein [Gemmataceae bacterium]
MEANAQPSRRFSWGPLFLGLPILAALLAGVAQMWTTTASGQERKGTLPPHVPVNPFPMPAGMEGVNLLRQTPEEAQAKSLGCISCHKDTHDPHYKDTVQLGCCDCHGGDPNAAEKDKAHVHPRFPEAWPTSANPVRSYTLLNHESPEFVRFVNPGDLRIAHISCGTTDCHAKEVLQNRKSMMTSGCMLWEAAGYNNGTLPVKSAVFGESYSMNGAPQIMQTQPPPTDEEKAKRGVVASLSPLPRFEIGQPANIFRFFERGGRFRPELGIPERDEESGRPRTRLSNRGLGTENRTDPGLITLQKTRLLDPTLNFMGTCDKAGDYRSSGCTSCHIIYANDRSPTHSGPYAQFGNRGQSFSTDPMIPKNESGHPIAHRFAPGNRIPTSQCIVCHMHPGTTVMNSYLGYLWWDQETDGDLMYPKKQKYPSSEERMQASMFNPDEAAVQGNWSDPAFLEGVYDLNSKAKHSQFADFHGHGWIYRAVYKQDRKGNKLDKAGNVLPCVGTEQLMAAMDPAERGKDGVPVHLLDIHLEKGMHCIDCHFVQDCHGNGRLQQEVRGAIEVQCIDCHGDSSERAKLRTTGPASYTSGEGGRNLEMLRTPFGKRRFERQGDKIIQNGMVEDKSWEIKQVVDTITKGHKDYNEKAALAKTVRFEKGEMVWGDGPVRDKDVCAHANKNMTCIACHSSWNPSCFGCHLSQKANQKTPHLHWDGDVTRNQVAYNFQTLRDDVYMLGRDGDVTGNRINPCRSSCAIHVSSYNNNREEIYVQQQTISGGGLSGVAFSSNVPHTVRGCGETKMCTDCHVAMENNNNAIMAQLLMQGTNYVNFMGQYCWVGAGEHGLFGVAVTEREEPQAVIGSTLQSLAFPDHYKKHVDNGYKLEHAHEHPGKDIGERLTNPFKKADVLQAQVRGEYVYAACGHDGLKVFDVAFIADKAFSERITSAPVSPCGQQFYVRTKDAKFVALPTTMTPDPTRTQVEANHEAKVHPMYGYAFVADECEGLIVVCVNTAIDGTPTNNFLKREVTFNPDGVLKGAKHITIVGTYAYVCCEEGLVVVSIEDPLHPVVTSVVNHEWLKHPVATACQFRYCFVCEKDGVVVLDITDLAKPRPVTGIKLKEAKNIYVARTYGYVAAGKQGLVILDLENPEKPKIDQVYDAKGCINDLHDVKLGITYVSEFAYLADGKNGMRIVQLTSPETPGNYGFSPRPTPKLIATYKIPHHGEALSVTKALDRDRAVDECGNQIAVFGRIGARPFNFVEQRKMYFRDGAVWRVSDDPKNPVYKELGTGPRLLNVRPRRRKRRLP